MSFPPCNPCKSYLQDVLWRNGDDPLSSTISLSCSMQVCLPPERWHLLMTRLVHEMLSIQKVNLGMELWGFSSNPCCKGCAPNRPHSTAKPGRRAAGISAG